MFKRLGFTNSARRRSSFAGDTSPTLSDTPAPPAALSVKTRKKQSRGGQTPLNVGMQQRSQHFHMELEGGDAKVESRELKLNDALESQEKHYSGEEVAQVLAQTAALPIGMLPHAVMWLIDRGVMTREAATVYLQSREPECYED